ncbi:hypothetical protein CVT24_005960, partial [Panaeolus cyanescens]
LLTYIFQAFAALGAAYAKTIVVTVGGNTTDNAGAVFEPQSVIANEGDIVFFNFTQGNHTVTQSTFAAPCVPAHFTNETINGFDSSFRNAGNFSAITNLPVTITNPNETIWFFDWNLCAQGGVGAININETSLETLDGFVRNAIRLNGTDSTSTSNSASPTATNPSHTANGTPTPSIGASPERTVQLGFALVLPAIALLAGISF